MLWRASRRGTRELSMILGAYVCERHGRMNAEERVAMDGLLVLPDADLWDMLVVEQADAQPEHARLVEDLRAYARTLHARQDI